MSTPNLITTNFPTGTAIPRASGSSAPSFRPRTLIVPMVRRLFLLVVGLWLVALVSSAKAQEAAFQLPAFLFEQGQYEASALEYLRVAFQAPELSSRAITLAALSLQADGRYEEASRLLERLLKDENASAADGEALFQLCLGEVLRETLQGQCDTYLKSLPDHQDGEPPVLARARYTLVMAEMLRSFSGLEHRDVPGTVVDPLLLSWRAEDLDFQAKSHSLPHKSPLVAGALSAVVPGLGRGYVGRWSDGFASFIMVAAPLVVSQVSLRQQEKASGLTYLELSAAGLLYAGNVYGSVVGARLFNEDQREALREEIRAAYRRRLGH